MRLSVWLLLSVLTGCSYQSRVLPSGLPGSEAGPPSDSGFTPSDSGPSDSGLPLLNASVLELDGIEDVVHCGDIDLGLPLTSYTLELWVRMAPGDTSMDPGMLVHKHPDACNDSGACSFRLWTDGTCFLPEPCSGPVPVCGIPLFQLCESCQVVPAGGCSFDGWHHFALVGDALTQSYTLYYDAEPSFPIGYPPPPLSASAWPLTFGREAVCGSDCDAFLGAIDEVRLWGFARSYTEIATDLNRRLRGDEPGLLAYWPFDEGTGDTTTEIVSGWSCTLGDANGVDDADPTWSSATPF